MTLAVIFFMALSAQASAKTFIECVAKTTTDYPSEELTRTVRSQDRFLFSFDADNGSRFENPKIKGTDCIPIINEKGTFILSEPDSIHIYCEPFSVSSFRDLDSYKIEIHRISGKFVKKVYN
tara:strand:- start:360 stop:725 length:366 start_codon:yes stop_codon:yes gene_type:complete